MFEIALEPLERHEDPVPRQVDDLPGHGILPMTSPSPARSPTGSDPAASHSLTAVLRSTRCAASGQPTSNIFV